MEQEAPGKWVLCLDGGGTRGISTLKTLEHLQEKAGISPLDFDMICGTSAGGLIAIAVGLLKLDLKQAEELFCNISAEVFKSRQKKKIKAAARLVGYAVKFEKPKITFHRLDILKQQIIQQVGNLRGEDVDLSQAMREFGKEAPLVFVVSSDIKTSATEPFLLRSYDHSSEASTSSNKMEDLDGTSFISLADAATATAAAPFYFDHGVEWRDHYLVDGGLTYNNPIELAVHEALRYWGSSCKLDVIVSIGTGEQQLSVTTGDWLAGWGSRIIELVTDSEMSHKNFERLRAYLNGVNHPGALYIRLNAPVVGKYSMDSPSKKLQDKIVIRTRKYLGSKPVKSQLQRLSLRAKDKRKEEKEKEQEKKEAKEKNKKNKNKNKNEDGTDVTNAEHEKEGEKEAGIP